MSGWHHGRLLAFDLETTGTDPFRDRIVEAALIEIRTDHTTHTVTHLIDPGIPIPAEATAVHHITTDHARTHGRSPVTATREIAEAILSCTGSGTPVVAFNASYDLTMLWAELVRHDHYGLADLITRVRSVVDPFVLDKVVDKYRKGSRKLVDVAAHYGITLTEQEAHGAAADALAAGRIAWVLGASYPADIGSLTLHALHDLQVAQKRAQTESFGAYLVKQGKPDDVSREWPIQETPAGWDATQLPTPREAAVA